MFFFSESRGTAEKRTVSHQSYTAQLSASQIIQQCGTKRNTSHLGSCWWRTRTNLDAAGAKRQRREPTER